MIKKFFLNFPWLKLILFYIWECFIVSIIDLSNTNNSIILPLLDVGIILGGLGVVLFRKIIYSALLLGFVFVCVALLYLLLNADFLAAAQVLVYVGAINVLIVFAIMLINNPEIEKKQTWTLGNGMSSILAIGLFSLLTNMILTTPWMEIISIEDRESVFLKEKIVGNVDTIGIHLLTDLLLPFELLSVLLLVALVGAIVIARKDISKELDTTVSRELDIFNR
uniref:NAD(P)H-quinone oxidoreductase subunit 6, chloroplastic n=1 Tax=Roya anglica TaxID=43943 RepID=A0A024B416_9VIRI|nr:subunit 6 of NADH-plastoquinone oxidoreductase [Roya anglica]AHZ11150.1 subunit 6 of NADH-plastoquinone oxidoreductase [Roya anglica]